VPLTLDPYVEKPYIRSIMDGHPRMTLQTMRLVGKMLQDPDASYYGLDLSRVTGLKSGTLYPILARLEKAGWLDSEWEVLDPREAGRPARRLYRLNPDMERVARVTLDREAQLLNDAVRPRAPRTLRPKRAAT
jgi:PadR family transcriptional regulator